MQDSSRLALAGSTPVVVLTGGIASGKSAVSARLQTLGVPIIDTDQIAREVVAPHSAGLNAVAKTFGPGVLSADGRLDRKALAEKVFGATEARRQLEAILHPLIEEVAMRRIQQLENAPYCILVVPLLVESGLFGDADLVVVVDVPEALQRRRLRERDEIDGAAADRILKAQASRQARLAKADRVLENTGSLSELSRQVDQLHADLLERFGARQTGD